MYEYKEIDDSELFRIEEFRDIICDDLNDFVHYYLESAEKVNERTFEDWAELYARWLE